MEKLLIPLLWAGWCLLWTLLARGSKKAQWRENARSKLSYTIPGVVGIASLAFNAPPDQFWFRPFLPWTPALYWGGICLMLAGFAITVRARRHLGANWSATVTVKHDHELITDGPYRLVRHPIYSGLMLAFLGTALPREDPRAVAALMLILLAFLRKAGIEEGRMIATFGEEYRAYRRRTKAIVPFLL